MSARNALLWILAGVVSVAVFAMLRPKLLPFAPQDWQMTAREAETQALESVRDLGEPVEDAYVVTVLSSRLMLERRLNLEADRIGEQELRDGRLGRHVFFWETWVYAPGDSPHEWTYRVEISLAGQLMARRLRLSEDEGSGSKGGPEARREADRYLTAAGFDLSQFAAPETRRRQLDNRTDLTLRYRHLEMQLGERFPYGIEVTFAGDRLAGHQRWFDDPEEDALAATLQPFSFLQLGKTIAVIFLLPLVAIPFVRRYHAGEIGVRRGLQIGLLIFVLGVILIGMTAVTISQGNSSGASTRTQMTWLSGGFMLGLVFVPVSIMAALTWSVGESLCRARYPGKLAAFDAVFQGEWRNATVARSSLRGLACAALIAGAMSLLSLALKSQGVREAASFQLGGWWYSSHWAGIVIIVFFTLWMLYAELFGRLFLVSFAAGRIGLIGGGLVSAIVSGVMLYGPAVTVASLGWFLLTSMVGAALLVIVFVRFDLWTSVTAGIGSAALAFGYPLLISSDSWLQFQGALPMLVAAVPTLISLRSLTSDEEFHYRYDDVPPHVRRIADRERQKVELETARRIQSSILPELPPEVNGVRISHAYEPASEVGGDFYDVLALEDGRLAVAVGDVAGHGVSSGLVMSMAKSALAVQVTFRPEVEEVFTTLNRMIFQSARKRLLTTLCYALVDPQQREVLYASAGHLFPYRITTGGQVFALESVSYPLGVRGEIDVAVRSARLESGDQLFMFSDGVVEAHGDGSDELFGFDRLEESLRRHTREGVTGIRDGVLADIAEFTGPAPRDDDLTVLVLQLP